MSKLFILTEAASIAIHGMILIANARAKESVNVNYIAEMTLSSRHHVAKVFQQLVKKGYVSSSRGPSGGFTLKADPTKISLLNIYETIEGEIEIHDCPLNKEICSFGLCIFENKIKDLTIEFMDYLKEKNLSDFLTKKSPGNIKQSKGR